MREDPSNRGISEIGAAYRNLPLRLPRSIPLVASRDVGRGGIKFMGYTASVGVPTIAEYPENRSWGYHDDGATTYLVFNRLGVVNYIPIGGVLPVAQGGTGTATPSGTYTPTLTNVANLDGSTAYQCQFLQVGSAVIVSGKVDVDPTAAGLTQLGISLPVASNLGAAEDCAGVAFASGIAGQGAAILGDAANNRASMEWIAVDLTAQPMWFTLQYEVI